MRIGPGDVESYIDPRYIARGEAIAAGGGVVFADQRPEAVEGFCCGTRVYRTRLFRERGKLAGDCTCPAFAGFGPCKHIAAMARALEMQARGTYQPAPWSLERVESFVDLGAQLQQLSREQLIGLILDLTEDETDLLERVTDLRGG